MQLPSFSATRLIPIFLLFTGLSQSFAAGVGINTTRIIVNQGSQAASVTLHNNTDEETYLVQSYLSADNAESTASAPFDALPPMVKMAPNSQQEVRLVEKSGLTTRLPTDRESVFYFHARAIPNNAHNVINPNEENHGTVKIALENVIKVFYRPKELTATPMQAQAGLLFKVAPGGVTVTNPSPYHVTLAGLTMGKQPITIRQQEAMLAPFSERTYPTTVKSGAIVWTTINDLGGYDVHHVPH